MRVLANLGPGRAYKGCQCQKTLRNGFLPLWSGSRIGEDKGSAQGWRGATIYRATPNYPSFSPSFEEWRKSTAEVRVEDN